MDIQFFLMLANYNGSRWQTAYPAHAKNYLNRNFVLDGGVQKVDNASKPNKRPEHNSLGRFAFLAFRFIFSIPSPPQSKIALIAIFD